MNSRLCTNRDAQRRIAGLVAELLAEARKPFTETRCLGSETLDEPLRVRILNRPRCQARLVRGVAKTTAPSTVLRCSLVKIGVCRQKRHNAARSFARNDIARAPDRLHAFAKAKNFQAFSDQASVDTNAVNRRSDLV